LFHTFVGVTAVGLKARAYAVGYDIYGVSVFQQIEYGLLYAYMGFYSCDKYVLFSCLRQFVPEFLISIAAECYFFDGFEFAEGCFYFRYSFAEAFCVLLCCDDGDAQDAASFEQDRCFPGQFFAVVD